MRICLIYDCLYPYTVGGAERTYRNLAERLAQRGHDVTYVTLRQWPRGERPEIAGVRVVAVGPRMELYVDERRRVAPPIVFGLGVFAHLLRHGRRYDTIHTASFPYFSLLAIGALRPLLRVRLLVDWHEVWSREYWRSYLGGIGGRIGHAVQRLCARIPHQAFCRTRLHADRLVAEGYRGEPRIVRGAFEGPTRATRPVPARQTIVYAGRHIPEKRVELVVEATAAARREVPELEAIVLGDGPTRPAVLERIAQLGLGDAVRAPGFVDREELEDTLAHALCLVLPSTREGFGLVVVEAASRGVPSVVVPAPDNGAVELIEAGQNGFVAAAADADSVARAILAVRDAGPALRERTADWFDANANELSVEGSIEVYAEAASLAVLAAQAEDRKQERREEDLDADDEQGGREDG